MGTRVHDGRIDARVPGLEWIFPTPEPEPERREPDDQKRNDGEDDAPEPEASGQALDGGVVPHLRSSGLRQQPEPAHHIAFPSAAISP